ncbi:Bax inhibitor-1/YccA family protein [Ferviditalea candida]|uniref:Bax inhibitor-1/YccA family protein n=1 Tax=Ferviditalea candida TaxID=3108399 RepID=A0ABU5ZLK0_9BACL|nr:Bax inhibitor-1/YccA family protein [Paenibacillaceae bacterium T2]
MNLEHGQSMSGVTKRSYNASFHKLLRMFTLSILVSFAGTVVGTEFIPPALVLPLMVVEFVMLISAFFVRRRGKPIGYAFVYIFTFISGITIFPSIQYYAQTGGAALVETAFLLTAVIFAGLTLYAYYSKRDFSFLGGFLMIGLLILIGFGLVGLFIGGFGSTLGLWIAAGGVLIFSGFILFDISRYKNGIPEDQIPLAVLNLYLNFINLFLYLLRLLGYSRD